MEVKYNSFDFKIKDEDGKVKIFDIVRRKWIQITPEEKVRQLWIHLLIYDLGYSPGLIQIEKTFEVNGRKKRIDICVFNTDMQPIILIECKAPDIDIRQDAVIEQLMSYNKFYQVEKFILTNGDDTFGFRLVSSIPVEMNVITDL